VMDIIISKDCDQSFFSIISFVVMDIALYM
jgi:hypothetical protein